MRIALADPSRAVQTAMTEMIGQGEHEVFAFCEGRTALNCLMTPKDVRALLTSVQLADISGIELCATARKLALRPAGSAARTTAVLSIRFT